MRSRGKAVVFLSCVILIGGIGIGVAAAVKENHRQTQRAIALTGGDPDKAMASIARYGCAACHDIPGTQMPGGRAAQSLSGITDRIYLGGAVNNTPDNLIRWIVNPKQFDPKSAMPVTGIGDAEARNVAAYLYRTAR
jgi:cytochrome c1